LENTKSVELTEAESAELKNALSKAAVSGCQGLKGLVDKYGVYWCVYKGMIVP
jgi:hypothetical protein